MSGAESRRSSCLSPECACGARVRASSTDLAMTMLSSALIMIAVIAALAYAGVLRPTGLAGRTRAEQETARQRAAAARMLDNADEPSERSPD